MKIYFPSCNFTKSSNKTSKKIRDYFKERMLVEGCCLYNSKEYHNEDIGYVMCQACRETLEDKITVQSIYEYIDQDDSFVYPNYYQQKMYFVDCFRDCNHDEIHQATRNLLKKMNIDIIEIEDNKEKSRYCGTLHYETQDLYLLEQLKQYPHTKISKLPEDLQILLMKDFVKRFDQDYPIIVDCNRCKKGIIMGGGNVIHLAELLFK